MFKLIQNSFLKNGVCKYADEYDNTVVIRRTGDVSFNAKIRFHDKRVHATPFQVDIQKFVDNEVLGDNLHLDYDSNVNLEEKSISDGINSFTELIQYWIELFSDLRFSWADNSLILRANDGADISDVYNYKIALLGKYEELEPIMKMMN